LAAGLGLEPRYYAPEAYVLPLDDPAIGSRITQNRAYFKPYLASEEEVYEEEEYNYHCEVGDRLGEVG
jgi:hypothetical protein